MGWGSFFMSLAGPLARQVLLSVGIGVVSYVGVDLMVSHALASAKASLSGLSGSVVQLLALGGVFTAMSIVAGGISAGLSMMVMKRFARIT